MTVPVLRLKGMIRSFGGLIAVNNVGFELPRGELHAIIGPNGAGKTTLFNLISGMLLADRGEIYFSTARLPGLPLSHQSARNCTDTADQERIHRLSVFDNIWIAAHSRAHFLHPLRSARSYRATAEKVVKMLEELDLIAEPQ